MSKFTEGEPFQSVHEALSHIANGGWVKAHGKPVHPSWALSWQVNMLLKGFHRMRPLFRKDGGEGDKAPLEKLQ